MSVIHDQDQPEQGICPLDAASSSDTRLKVVNSIGNIDSVSKVAGSDNKTATADSIGPVAESKCLLWRKVGDLATLLLVASVAVKHNTSDLVLDGSGETPDGSNHNSGALRVATSDDFRVWTFGVCEVEEALGLAVGSAGGAFGKKVRSEGGIIGTSNTLASDITGTVGGLQAITSRGANGITLFNKNRSAEGGTHRLDHGHAYEVASFRGSTSEDECDGTAIAVGKFVDSRANTTNLSARLHGGWEGGGSAGEESDGGRELHVCGQVVIGVFIQVCVCCS